MNIEANTRLMLDRLNGVQDIGGLKANEVADGDSFGTVFGGALNQLTEKQIGADQSVQALIMGEDIEMHDVMIQTTEAQLSLELAVQVRNKCLEAFNEMKNMQF